jgi:hypothetical protein
MQIPVNRLPPEILSKILQHRGCGQDLIMATHVCRYWRSVLISDQSLWTSYQFSSTHDVDRTLAYLKRCEAMTIDIKINLKDLQNLDVLQHLVPHIARTKSFIIEGSSDVFTASSILLCERVPSLEYLSMRVNEHTVYTLKHSVRALNNFLGQQAPSLRSVVFDSICPLLGSPFQLPSLTDLDLNLPDNAGPIRMSSLFRLLSNCPRLQKACIAIHCKILQDVTLDQVVSLDSLVKLVYTCHTSGRFTPFLKLPRLKSLHIALDAGKVDHLADILPHSSHTLLSEATSMWLLNAEHSQRVGLSGNGVNISFTMSRGGTGVTSAGFYDGAYIPFEQIEDLEFGGCDISADFPLNRFKELSRFRVNPCNKRIAEEVLWLLRPRHGGIPCPSLREITYTLSQSTESYMIPLINLAIEREQAGCQVELLFVPTR